MAHQYKPRGVCSRRIAFDLTDGVVRNVSFEGGCSGNTQGIARLVEGMPAEEAIRSPSGISTTWRISAEAILRRAAG